MAREPQRRRGKLWAAALFDATAAVFAEKDYDAATMTEIAARANAAIGSLHQFLRSKEALADALLPRYGERVAGGGQLADRAEVLSPKMLADALVDLILDLRSDRAAAIALTEVRRTEMRGDAADKRARPRDAIRRRIAANLMAANRDMPGSRAEPMATGSCTSAKPFPPQPKKSGRAGRKTLWRKRATRSGSMSRHARPRPTTMIAPIGGRRARKSRSAPR